MATFSVLSDERNSNIKNLNEIIEECVAYIKEIDGAIAELVEGGIKGSAINTMSTTYQTNRETISDYLKVFAQYSLDLQEQEQRLEKWNEEADSAAVGKQL